MLIKIFDLEFRQKVIFISCLRFAFIIISMNRGSGDGGETKTEPIAGVIAGVDGCGDGAEEGADLKHACDVAQRRRRA